MGIWKPGPTWNSRILRNFNITYFKYICKINAYINSFYLHRHMQTEIENIWITILELFK